MARTGGIVNYNTFVKGLITEASPLTYPENATSREENFELRRDGTRARRYGMDFESGYDSTNIYAKSYIDDAVLMSYEWFNAGNTENDNFLVVQVGQYLDIYSMEESTISPNKRGDSIDLNNYVTETNTLLDAKDFPVTVTVLKGFLIVVNPIISPIYISYNHETGGIAVTKISLEVRDLFGIPDETISVDHRPATLSDKHNYNLKNQGWTSADITATAVAAPTGLGVYPSNADIPHLAKQTAYDATPGYTVADIGTYNPNLLDNTFFGTTPAPKGKLIYEVFDRTYKDVSAGTSVDITSISVSGDVLTCTTIGAHGLTVGDEVLFKDIGITVTAYITFGGTGITEHQYLTGDRDPISDNYFIVNSTDGLEFTVSLYHQLLSETIIVDGGTITYLNTTYTYGNVITPATPDLLINQTSEKYRPKCVSGYAGRVWFSGMDGGEYGSYLFFSQILDSPGKIGKCYQEADPTSEHISDLVDTDGGFIVIPEARNIQSLVTMGQYLFVFSTNGVWRIFGDDGGNFKATAFSVEKVSDIGVASRFSIVPVENEIFYWAKGGIYKVGQNVNTGSYESINISQSTIQTLFFEITQAQHKYVKGSYDSVEKKITWLYNRRAPTDTGTNYKYDSMIILDSVLGAFYKYLLPSDSDGTTPYLSGLFNIPDVSLLRDIRTITSQGSTVVSGINNVVSSEYLNRSQTTQTKYLTIVDINNTADAFITFSEIRDASFVDYKSFDSIGTDAAAYMITGSDVQGSQANKKQAHYLMMYFNRTEQSIVVDGSGNLVADNPSSCKVNALWDWATDINSIRAGSQFQAYRLNRLYLASSPSDAYTYGEEVVVTKNKLRGRGRSLSIAIQSEAGKDLHVYGWSLLMSGGQRP
jgi:hypothetical protein